MTDLPQTMRAIRQAEPGGPLSLEELPVPQPGPGEVLVQVAASPINPSDLAMLEGGYGISFAYPMTPGLEGSGLVVAEGGGIMPRLMRGRRVACAAGSQGLWAEFAAVPSAQCLPLPDAVSLGAGAMAVVNPLTAYAFLRIARSRGHRSLVSTAAGGQLGGMIRALGRQRGIEVINVVRGADQVARLQAEGAVAHDLKSPAFDADLAGTCKRLKCRLALDAVAGDMTYRLVEALPKGAEILLYGALSEKAASAHPGSMIFKEATIEGFWLTRWLARKSLPEMLWITRQVTGALAGGFAVSRVARIVPLDDAPAAPGAYQADMSAGKFLIAPGRADLGIDVTGPD